VKLGGEFLARGETAVDVEQLEQVDDRDLPVQLLRVGGREFFQLRDDVDDGDRLRRRGAAGTLAGAGAAAGGGIVGFGAGGGAASALPKPSFSRILPKKLMRTSLRAVVVEWATLDSTLRRRAVSGLMASEGPA